MSEEFTLRRFKQGLTGTFGELTSAEGEILCVTCEDPWDDNRVGQSCIPAGFYICEPHSGPKYKDVWQVTNVPNRTAVLIHNGNTIEDTRGCILVGRNFANFPGNMKGITDSRATLNELRDRLPPHFSLRIIDDF